MFKGKTLTEYTNLFHQIILRRMMIWFCFILKMNVNNSIEAIDETIFALIFSITAGIVEKLLNISRNVKVNLIALKH